MALFFCPYGEVANKKFCKKTRMYCATTSNFYRNEVYLKLFDNVAEEKYKIGHHNRVDVGNDSV